MGEEITIHCNLTGPCVNKTNTLKGGVSFVDARGWETSTHLTSVDMLIC